jgi:hypothetical protein
MKHIINYLSNIIKKELPKPIGRWKIEYCDKKINNKIDLSNEDHCGPCGQYAKLKINKDICNDNNIINNNDNNIINK